MYVVDTFILFFNTFFLLAQHLGNFYRYPLEIVKRYFVYMSLIKSIVTETEITKSRLSKSLGLEKAYRVNMFTTGIATIY